MKLPAERVSELLETWPVARLATVDDAGHPHQVPIVFARVGQRLWSPIDGKPKRASGARDRNPPELARVRNVRATGRACLLLDEYDSDWTRLWWLRVDATARVVEAGAGAAEAASAVVALRQKYPQYETTAVLAEPATLLVFEPTTLASWSWQGSR